MTRTEWHFPTHEKAHEVVEFFILCDTWDLGDIAEYPGSNGEHVVSVDANTPEDLYRVQGACIDLGGTSYHYKRQATRVSKGVKHERHQAHHDIPAVPSSSRKDLPSHSSYRSTVRLYS